MSWLINESVFYLIRLCLMLLKILGSEKSNTGAGKLFSKEPDSKYFMLYKAHMICHIFFSFPQPFKNVKPILSSKTMVQIWPMVTICQTQV